MPASSPLLNQPLRTNREAAAEITAEQQRAEIARTTVLKNHVPCAECDGTGLILRDDYYRPWAEGNWEECEECHGWGTVEIESD